MNILYLTNHLNIGGITSYVLSLVKGLKAKGHQVYVASSGGELVFRFIQEGLTFIPIPIKTKSEASPKILLSFLKLRGRVKKYHIDIIHSNSRTTQVLGCLLSKFTQRPHISTCHGFFKPRLSRKIFDSWGKRVIAISESVREHLITDFAVKPERIKVIYHGIDVDKSKIQNPKSKTEIKKKLGLSDGPVVGIVARLSAEKGHRYLIKAISEVSLQIPDVQLLIVGEGRTKRNLLDLTKKFKIEAKVCFMSSVMDTGEVLSATDLFAMPSLKEGLGLSLMEAMAAGLPVVASDVGGIKSLIQEGHNGLLVEPANTQQLTSAILKLLQDRTKAESLGKQAQIFIKDNFSQEKMAQETEKLYSECLNIKS